MVMVLAVAMALLCGLAGCDGDGCGDGNVAGGGNVAVLALVVT